MVHFDSTPPGATIVGVEDGRQYCDATPCDVPFEVEDRKIAFVAQLAGYDDRTSQFNPRLLNEKNTPVKVKLVKPAGRAPNTTKVQPKSAGSGSANAPRTSSKTGGELGTFNPP